MNTETEKKGMLRRGQRIALVSSLITLAVALVKGVTGYAFESHLLIADAIHSAGDVVTVAASGFGLWLAARKKSEKFPYGLYRAETVATLFMGLLILWAGVEMAQDGYDKFLQREAAAGFPLLPMGAAILSIVANLFMAKKQEEAGRAINSQSLLVKARDTKLDVYVSGAVLVGILMASWGISYVEGGLIFAIALLIFKLGGETVSLSVMSLLDADLDADLRDRISAMIGKIPGVRAVTVIRIRRAGPFRMVDCTIETAPHLPLYKAHELADRVEESIVGTYRDMDTVFVHVEPFREKVFMALVPVEGVNGLDSVIHEHFGRAPYFALVRIDESDGELVDFYYNEFLGEKLHIGVKIIKAVSSAGIDILFTRQIGELSFSLLKERFVDIYKVEGNPTLREIIAAYRHGGLLRLHEPTHMLEDSETERLPEPSLVEKMT
jgi:cation diffusion facilitator family transporter